MDIQEATARGVVMFSTSICPYCERAERFLRSKGAEVKKIMVDADAKTRQDMADFCGGKRSVPQIFIDGTHIGGCDDLLALNAAQPERLAELLRGAGS
jgi:glutaredoxin 3